MSPDGRYLYHNDSGRGLVYRFELAGDGTLRDRRVFLRFRPEEGAPDGMTVDSEGALWIAIWGGARVSRYTTDGHLDRSVNAAGVADNELRICRPRAGSHVRDFSCGRCNWRGNGGRAVRDRSAGERHRAEYVRGLTCFLPKPPARRTPRCSSVRGCGCCRCP